MRLKFSQLWLVIVAALAFVSVLAAHSVEPSAINVPNSAEAQSGSSNVQSIGKELEQEQLTHTPSRDTASSADVETALRFNELRQELLDSREKMVDWWLEATAIFLTLLGVVAAIVGFFGFKSFRTIEKKARKSMEAATKHAEEAKSYVQEIKRSRDDAASLVKEINAEVAGENPEKADKVVRNVQQNPNSTLIEKAVAAAISLQQRNKIEEAINKWTSIANVLEGIDNELASGAWFSVGYLRSFKSEDRKSIIEVIEAYDKSIDLNSKFYEAYNNLGVSKFRIGQYDSAIADFDKALALKTDDAHIYCNRGNAKACLRQYASAIIDYDKAINHKPDFTEAYNLRGNAKFCLRQYSSAIADYDEVLALKKDDTEVYCKRGTAKAEIGQYEPAISDFDNALVLKPDYAEAYYNRSMAKIELNHINEGRKDVEKAYKFAQAAGDAELVARAASLLKTLDKGETP